jgi:hypothetical protein
MFDKWFGLASFRQGTAGDAIATTGFAANAGALYIGAFYSGNFWAGKPVSNYIEGEPATVPAGGAAGTVYKEYNNINVFGTTVNNVALLFGFADMGIRLTYRTNYQSFSESGIVTGNQLYKNYNEEYGYIAPQIAWAMAKNLTSNGIRPYATVDLDFHRDYLKTETEGPDSDTYTGERVRRSANIFEPALGLGLGGYTFLNKDSFRLSCDLDYILTLKIYNNEYSYADNGVYRTGKIRGSFSPASISFIERSYISNSVTPSLSGQWSKDKLSLRFKLNLPIIFSREEANAMDLDSSNNLIYIGASNLYSTFIFQPDLRLAFQYKFVPDKFALNVGARLQATAITLQTVKETNYSYDINGDQIIARRKLTQDTFGTGFVSRFSIGLTFNFTENFWVDASTGITNAFGENAIDIFTPGGLFSFGSIMLVLKF